MEYTPNSFASWHCTVLGSRSVIVGRLGWDTDAHRMGQYMVKKLFTVLILNTQE